MIVIVETKSGKIKGYTSNGLQIFKGIPYAAPPTGPLRFSAPAPVEPWADIRDATEFGPYAPQGDDETHRSPEMLAIEVSESQWVGHMSQGSEDAHIHYLKRLA